MLFGLLQKLFARENMLRISDGKWTTNKILGIAFLVLIHRYLLVEQ